MIVSTNRFSKNLIWSFVLDFIIKFKCFIFVKKIERPTFHNNNYFTRIQITLVLMFIGNNSAAVQTMLT